MSFVVPAAVCLRRNVWGAVPSNSLAITLTQARRRA
jgi:hypothetical protein